MTLFDILGKTHELPVHTFWGGLNHDRLHLLGLIGSGTPKEDAAAIEKMFGEGYGTIMIKMGALPVSRETERIIVAEGIGNRFNRNSPPGTMAFNSYQLLLCF